MGELQIWAAAAVATVALAGSVASGATVLIKRIIVAAGGKLPAAAAAAVSGALSVVITGYVLWSQGCPALVAVLAAIAAYPAAPAIYDQATAAGRAVNTEPADDLSEVS